MRTDHEIFHHPNQVKLTFEDRPPELSYLTRASGKDLGKTMPMWRVQTEGYKDEKGMLVGVVSPSKLLDIAPDSEYISAGENTKGCDSVALGRQGSYFHWGFAASPTYMTDEAKLVFVNSIHYISKFKGQRAFVKKRVYATRSTLEDTYYTLSDEGFARWQEMLGKARKVSEAGKRKLQRRKDDGEELTEMEEMILASPPMKEYTRFDLTDFPEALRDEFGENWDKYETYYRSNYDFLFCPDAESGRGFYLDVDSDAKQIGIPNDRIEILERCIELLRSGKETDRELAQRVLERYTNEKFANAGQWNDWLTKYRDYLFFSEISGFKFIVDLNRIPDSLKTRPSSVQVTTEEELDSLVSSLEVEKASKGTPARFNAVLKQIQTPKGPRARLIVKANILYGWHLYAHVPKNEPYIETQVSVAELQGVEEAGKWKRSAGGPDPMNSRLLIWEDNAVVTRDFILSQETDVSMSVTIQFQVCDQNSCKRPQEKTFKVTLED